MNKIKAIKVEVVKYQTSDGRVFNDQDEAQIQQDLLNGTKQVCGSCNGSGEIPNDDFRGTQRCGTCGGKGYLVQKWTKE